MGERFSVLKPLEIEIIEKIVFKALWFFAPLNSKIIMRKMGKLVTEGEILPLSINDFILYLKNIDGIEVERYRMQIVQLIHKMEISGVLSYVGRKGYTAGAEKYYYFVRELSQMQKEVPLWIGEFLGIQYIQHKLKDYVVLITGEDINGDLHNGTGALINGNTILTNRHVITEIKKFETVNVFGNSIKISEMKTSSRIDIGVIKLAGSVEVNNHVVFGIPKVLDEILVMGYPSIPRTNDAYLISQSGEVNSIVLDYHENEGFIYSSITRPGNSGSPIFTKAGHLIGIAAEHLEIYRGISSREIMKELEIIDPESKIKVENYM